jgi:hypothetical protein
MVVMLGPPFDPTHRSNCVDQVFQFGIGRVPDLDLFQTLEGCVIVALQGCVIVALQGCVIVALLLRCKQTL